ncbi:MarR family transcriptional regulator [Streptomyces sp. SCUT-3]|nr:MarR family transcriptional regulator [Streptomyces sp. SCUT-3]
MPQWGVTSSPLPPPTAEAACAASSAVELLEVLWGRGREVSAAPVSPSQLRVLFVLEHQEGINLRTLAEAMESTPPSVSRLCDRLQAVGFLERAPCPSSRRELVLRLTRRGAAYLADLRARRERELHKVVAAMPPADRAALLAGLTSFCAAAAAEALPPAGEASLDASRTA